MFQKKLAEPKRLRYSKVRKYRLFIGKSKKLAEPANYDDEWMKYGPFIDETDEHTGWGEKGKM